VPNPKKTVKRKPRVGKKNTGRRGWRVAIVIILLIITSPFYYGYVLRFFSSGWQWLRDLGHNPNYRAYKSFGIHIPSQYKIHGIDVSYAQGRIDWQRVRSMHEDSISIGFAFIKATEGLLKVDPYFKRNWREAPKNGITTGAYHFFRANRDGKWQARFFLQNVAIEPGDLPPVVDVETLDGQTPDALHKQLQAFLTYVQLKTNVKPIIYTQLSFYADYLAGYFNAYTLWIAHYNHPELRIEQGVGWRFWQHSETARVSGIGSFVDFDAFRGDSVAFKKMLVK
jgi:lysozyme